MQDVGFPLHTIYNKIILFYITILAAIANNITRDRPINRQAD